MLKPKNKYKNEWQNFWKNSDIPKITKICYRMEFEIARECYTEGEKSALNIFFNNRSDYFPLISSENEELVKEDLFIHDFSRELLINRWKITSYFHSYTLKLISTSIIFMICIFLLSLILKLNLISVFFSESHLLVNMLLLVVFVIILYLITFYSSSRVGDRDIYFKKIQQIHKASSYIILPLFLCIFLSYIIINGNRSLKDIEFVLEINQFLYLWLLDFWLFTFLLSFPIYLIENQKKFQYYLFRFVNSVKSCYEINEIYILFYFKNFISNLSQNLKNFIDLTIANINEIEMKFYQAFFSVKLEVLKDFVNNLEEIILDPDNYDFFKFKFSALKKIIQILNNFFKGFKIPEISFKNYTLIDFLLEKYKKISALITIIIAVITTIISIFI